MSDERWSDIETDAEPALRAAEKVVAGFAEAIAAYRKAVDRQP